MLRVALVTRLGPAAPLALILTGAASRLVPVWLMTALPYVTDPGVAKSGAVTAAGRTQAVIATAWVGVLTIAVAASHRFGGLALAVVWFAAIAVAFASGRLFHARVGGITGDFLGAAQQISECAMLLGIALVRGDAA